MKTGVWVSILLTALTLVVGIWSGSETRALSESYITTSDELRTLAESENWQALQEETAQAQEKWQQKVPWLQMLINHEDVDDVTMALKKLQAAADMQELPMCLEACTELNECAGHLYHRDALTLGNIL